jgi:hypothetical protein
MDYRKFEELPVPDGAGITFAPISNILIADEINPVNNSVGFPQWWKDIERGDGGQGTFKSCEATQDFLLKGYTLKLWSTAVIRQRLDSNDWEIFYDAVPDNVNKANDILRVGYFDYKQTGKCPMTDIREVKEANYVKLINPWLMRTAPGYSSLIIPALYTPNQNFTVLPAIINTDYYHSGNIVMNVLGKDTFTIPMGTPLVHIIPFRRNDNNDMQILDETAYKFLAGRGFGTIIPPKNRKGLYRKTAKAIKKKLGE